VRAAKAVLVTAALLALCAPAASAHTFVRVQGSTLSYHAPDDAEHLRRNEFSIVAGSATYKVTDRDVDYIDPGNCIPISSYEVDCPREGVAIIHTELGPGDDRGVHRVGIPTEVFGGPGNDTLTAGSGDDLLSGDDGADVLLGSAGNDDIRARDGAVDEISCGDGTDAVSADASDVIRADGGRCEAVDTSGRDPAAPGDRTAPRVRLRARKRQSFLRRRQVVVAASASEPGIVTLSGTVSVPGSSRVHRLRKVSRRATVGGTAVRLRTTLSRRGRAAVSRALRRRKRVVAKVRVRAADRAGNAGAPAAMRIRLTRRRPDEESRRGAGAERPAAGRP
jgi:RTX calcium-binding nonapeptide repeat (4 copies)